MREERFEKVVEWEAKNGWIILILSVVFILFLMNFLGFISLFAEREIDEAQSIKPVVVYTCINFAIMVSAFLGIIGNIITALSFRKVYWRKVR